MNDESNVDDTQATDMLSPRLNTSIPLPPPIPAFLQRATSTKHVPTNDFSSIPPPPRLTSSAFPMQAKTHRGKQNDKRFWTTLHAEIPDSAGPCLVPCTMFFYGTLMDSELLQSILSLPTPPELKRGTINGFRMKMWGTYPTLIQCGNDEKGEVEGIVWHCETDEEFRKLAAYETRAYTWCDCNVEVEQGEGNETLVENAKTFIWAGDPESKELDEGVWDFERWRRYFKPGVVGKSAVEE